MILIFFIQQVLRTQPVPFIVTGLKNHIKPNSGQTPKHFHFITLVLVINSYKSPENVENFDSSQSQTFLRKRGGGVLGEGKNTRTSV